MLPIPHEWSSTIWWTGKPHTEIFSNLVHILKDVLGLSQSRRRRHRHRRRRRRLPAKESWEPSIVSSLHLHRTAASHELGFDLLAAINSRQAPHLQARRLPRIHREFWSQISKARSVVRPNQTINFFVDPSEGHDDFLSSLALLVHASHYIPRRATGRLRQGYE